MSTSVPDSAAGPTDLAWRVVGLLNLYRLLVPPTLLAIWWFAQPQPTLGTAHPRLFVGTCAAYFALGIALVVARKQFRASQRMLVLGQAVVDVTAVTLLVLSSGGVPSGLGILLVVPVGALALLATGRDALLIASLAALALLGQQAIGQWQGTASSVDYPLAGVLGVVVFLVALLAWPVATRLRESEALVQQRELDLANLAELSQYIVQHLRESLLVVDTEDRIRLINEPAAQLLGDARAYPGALLGEASPRLLYLLETWRQSGANPSDLGTTFLAADGARDVQPHFAHLGSAQPSPVLVFLEDQSLIGAKVQQTKLAALGRLSASIAHEIRNPVGAMSHAAQLLSESSTLAGEDRRLGEIIRSNAQRVSAIVDNVQSLSRREASRPKQLDLGAWLAEFRAEFCATQQLAEARLLVAGPAEPVDVRADPSQLRQIAWNLCDNAFKHGTPPDGIVEVRFGRHFPSLRPYLEVQDRGGGIPDELVERIFEPFVTGEARGTGLGLFLARELAQTNGATLLYEPRAGGGSVFRLVFADPLRWAP